MGAMPRKPAHQQFDTSEILQERAFELFGRYGYEGVSVGDIAAVAQLSKGALYWHFHGKAQLYLACQARLHALFDHFVFAPMRVEADATAAVLAMFNGLELLLRDARVEQGVAGFWLIPDKPETAQIIAAQRAFEAAATQTVRDVLKRGREQRHFDLAGDEDDMARAIISLVEAVVLPLRHQAPDEVRRTLGVLARTFFRAYAGSGVSK